eukprot:TRINITY_DN18757_c0_g1_i1.p1 TRINITY_DN18757_c0_g1~~TRINITY_DN18757_c0_g1_i1.p1  ORF type:complete len:600 (+),score=200.36 TRINITY_DN18757_c0_g1_i1:65-1801(+)
MATTATEKPAETTPASESLTVEEKVHLITRNLQEVMGGDEALKKKVAEQGFLKIYWGTAPTGKPHVGYFVPMTKIADFLRAGCHVTILFADLHAFLDNMKAPWDLLSYRTQYYEAVIKGLLESVGVPLDKLHFVRGTDYQLSREFTLDVYKLSSKVSQHDAKKAGAEVVKQTENPILSGLMYPLLQALDEVYIGVDAQFGGADQRKIFALAEESLPRINYPKRIHLMNPMVPSLSAARMNAAPATAEGNANAVQDNKMSASNPDSKIDLLEDPESVARKVAKAFCEPGNVKENGLLSFCKMVLFPLQKDKPLRFERPEKFGGPVEFADYATLEAAFAAQTLFPADLKNGVIAYLNRMLAPIRAKFIASPELQELVAKAYPNEPVPSFGGPKKQQQQQKKEKQPKQKASPAADRPVDVSRARLSVGLIEKADKHPDADSLFVETVDFGALGKFTIVSGLAKYMAPEDLAGRKAVFVTNLKPNKLRGIVSQGMILAASNEDHTKVEVVFAPDSTPVGERVSVAGFAGEADAMLRPDKHVWDQVQPLFSTNASLEATWKDVPLMTTQGSCKVASLVKASIK